MKKIKLLFLSLCLTISGIAQTFHRAIGTTGNEYGHDVITTSDGGQLFVGFTPNYNNGDISLIKVASDGSITWQRHYGTTTEVEEGYSVAQLTDGNYVVGGYTMRYPAGASAPILIKINATTGNVLWVRTYDTTAGNNSMIRDIYATSDGGFVATGVWDTGTSPGSFFKTVVIKMSSSGLLAWHWYYNIDNQTNRGESIKKVSDGGYIVTGYIGSRALLLKLTSTGAYSWAKGFKAFTSIGSYSTGFSVIETSDGSYVIESYAYDGSSPEYAHYLFKTNSSGTLLWSKVHGDGISSYEGKEVAQTSDGGFICATLSGQLIKLNASGSFQWGQRFKGSFEGLALNASGEFIMGGMTTSFGAGAYDHYQVRTDATGVCCASKPITIPEITHTTSTASYTATSTYLPTYLSTSVVWGTMSDPVASKCNCVADAGPHRTNYTTSSCCTPPSTCSSVSIGTTLLPGYTCYWTPSTALSCSTCGITNANPCSTTVYTIHVSGPGCFDNTDDVRVLNIYQECCGPRSFEPGTEETNNIIIYPNPSSGILNISLSKESDEKVFIEVYDITGKLVHFKDENSNTKNLQLDLTSYGKGVYYVNVYQGSKRHSEKIILE